MVFNIFIIFAAALIVVIHGYIFSMDRNSGIGGWANNRKKKISTQMHWLNVHAFY